MGHLIIFTVLASILALQQYQVNAQQENENVVCNKHVDRDLANIYEVKSLFGLYKKKIDRNATFDIKHFKFQLLIDLITTCNALPQLTLNERQRDYFNCVCNRILENKNSIFEKNELDLALNPQEEEEYHLCSKKHDRDFTDYFEVLDLIDLYNEAFNRNATVDIEVEHQSNILLINLIRTCNALPQLTLNETERDYFNCVCNKILENTNHLFPKDQLDVALQYQNITQNDDKDISCYVELVSNKNDLQGFINQYGDDDEIDDLFRLYEKTRDVTIFYTPMPKKGNNQEYLTALISTCIYKLPQTEFVTEDQRHFFKCVCNKIISYRYSLFSKKVTDVTIQGLNIQKQIQDLQG